jgi:hypothetical protein
MSVKTKRGHDLNYLTSPLLCWTLVPITSSRHRPKALVGEGGHVMRIRTKRLLPRVLRVGNVTYKLFSRNFPSPSSKATCRRLGSVNFG